MEEGHEDTYFGTHSSALGPSSFESAPVLSKPAVSYPPLGEDYIHAMFEYDIALIAASENVPSRHTPEWHRWNRINLLGKVA